MYCKWCHGSVSYSVSTGPMSCRLSHFRTLEFTQYLLWVRRTVHLVLYLFAPLFYLLVLEQENKTVSAEFLCSHLTTKFGNFTWWERRQHLRQTDQSIPTKSNGKFSQRIETYRYFYILGTVWWTRSGVCEFDDWEGRTWEENVWCQALQHSVSYCRSQNPTLLQELSRHQSKEQEREKGKEEEVNNDEPITIFTISKSFCETDN